jgi:hypothetical protein
MWNTVESLRNTSQLLSWCAFGFAVLAAASTLGRYFVDQRASELTTVLARPRNQKVTIGSCTAEVLVESPEAINTNFADSGGYCAFGRDGEAMLLMSAHEASAQQTGDNHVVWRGVFHLDAKDPSVGKALGFLGDAQFLQIGFLQLRRPAKVTGGTAVVILNGIVRIEFIVPPQLVDGEYVIIRDLTLLRKAIE